MAADQGSSAYAQTTPTNAYGPSWVSDSTAQVSPSAPVAAYAQPTPQASQSSPSQPSYPASGGGAERDGGDAGREGGMGMGVDISNGVGATQ